MEKLAKFTLIFLVAAAVILPLAGKALSASGSAIDIHARVPENGGWSQDVIRAQPGQPIHLRLTSDDVQHSFAIGQNPMAPVAVVPGEWKDITLVFDQPGKYTFYCTRWCGPQHWRMRGTIEVTGGLPSGVEPAIAQPLYLALNLDLDASHKTDALPPSPPDASRGSKIAHLLPVYAMDRQTYLTHSPAELWKRLRTETALSQLSDADLWDAVAFIWEKNTTPQQLESARKLFAENCAACHGESGRGDGVMMSDHPTPAPDESMKMASNNTMASGHNLTRPPDFSDPARTLGASPALLEGKLLRGGMGTGMPYWGPIFTKEQIDALVSYLYTLVRYR